MGYLRQGSLHPIAASETSRRLLQRRPLTALSRRALYEKKPLAVNSVLEHGEKPDDSGPYDWELDWPAILYVPVAQLGRDPVGLLVLGCRKDHWYTEEDIAYAHSLGVTLAPAVEALRGPLARLSGLESEVAQLLSFGLSHSEIARAVHVDDRRARSLVEAVLRKLRSVSAGELTFPLIPMKRRAFRL